jgi:hypothetical protein
VSGTACQSLGAHRFVHYGGTAVRARCAALRNGFGEREKQCVAGELGYGPRRIPNGTPKIGSGPVIRRVVSPNRFPAPNRARCLRPTPAPVRDFATTRHDAQPHPTRVDGMAAA